MGALWVQDGCRLGVHRCLQQVWACAGQRVLASRLVLAAAADDGWVLRRVYKSVCTLYPQRNGWRCSSDDQRVRKGLGASTGGYQKLWLLGKCSMQRRIVRTGTKRAQAAHGMDH